MNSLLLLGILNQNIEIPDNPDRLDGTDLTDSIQLSSTQLLNLSLVLAEQLHQSAQVTNIARREEIIIEAIDLYQPYIQCEIIGAPSFAPPSTRDERRSYDEANLDLNLPTPLAPALDERRDYHQGAI